MVNYKSRHYWSVVKQTDEVVNDSTTLQDDNELKIDSTRLQGATQYGFSLFLLFKAHATPDLKYDIELNGNTGLRMNSSVSSVSSTGTANLSTTVNITCDDTVQCCLILGHILTGATPGSLIFRWCQNTTSSEDTKILAGSTLTVFRTTI